ncbi:hypothetical protein [Natrinema longum]|uniref:hypothetical protein n=1 Tax=Natrinema longum TaxID=370324 RepID=UPI001CCFE944|nr:hypothetical protein [Natrinema longum]MBZ6497022.1 hypothetical protein [Natrinema longum]
MDRTEYYLVVIIFLLASIIQEVGDQHTPDMIAIISIAIVYISPIYLLINMVGDFQSMLGDS